VRKRTSELQNIAHEQHETILRLSGGEAAGDKLVVIPDVTDEVEPEASDDALSGGGAGGGALGEAPDSDPAERHFSVTDEFRPA
jgi:hypothetical protein